MKYRVYIESLNNFPIGDWGISAYIGWRDRQTDVIFFEDINEVPASPFNIVVGCIETTNAYFDKLGIAPKKALNLPASIEHWAKRRIQRMTMAQFREADMQYPIFVKGDGKAKQFIPGVVKDKSQVMSFFKHVKDDEPVMLSEVIDIVSEYRCYVIEGEVKGIKHYTGNIYVFPDGSRIQEMVRDYADAPSGYTLDVGITDEGDTILIECNDGWSIGNYGLDNSLYVKLLSKRWLELTKVTNK